MNSENIGFDLLGKYFPLPGSYDEMLDQSGNIRKKYSFILQSLGRMSPEELLNRKRDTNRILNENGVTYNVYGTEAPNRTWSLDIFPLLLESTEWEGIESGLIQRAELLNCFLDDIYGRQRVLQENIIPPEIVWRSPAFLRPAYGTLNSNRNLLAFAAMDLIRDESGEFQVIGHRLQAPSGSGYALENRIVLSRILPSIYRDSEVHRISLFFRSLRQSFSALTESRKDPLVVLLTPGPANETFFEHSYLSSYLGFYLAQSEDLTVKGRQLYLKTVEGLQPVDVLFRRVDDIFMDPMELKGDSLLGIPGLLEVVRSGNVLVMNPIGIGLLENRALDPYWNQLAKFYLGEELRIKTADTLWLGDSKSLTDFLANPQGYILKSSLRDYRIPSRLTDSILSEEWQQVKEDILRCPRNFVAQKNLAGSSCPILSDNGLVAGKMVLRSFVTASETGYRAMPGGLLRVSQSAKDYFVTNQMGAISKDVWILASEPQKEVTLLTEERGPISISRKGKTQVSSRGADNLFWMGRYTERTDYLARILREIVRERLKSGTMNSYNLQKKLLRILTHVTGSYPGFLTEQESETELLEFITSPLFPGGLENNIQSITRLYRALQHWFAEDARLSFVRLQRFQIERVDSDSVLHGLQELIQILASINGMISEGMTQEESFFFLDLGKRIERANLILRLVKAMEMENQMQNLLVWESMLNINENRITYRRRYDYKIELASILDLILFDSSNPRSLCFQFEKISNGISILPRFQLSHSEWSREQRLALKLMSDFRSKEAHDFLKEETDFVFREWLESVENSLFNLSESIRSTYFQYSESQTSIG